MACNLQLNHQHLDDCPQKRPTAIGSPSTSPGQHRPSGACVGPVSGHLWKPGRLEPRSDQWCAQRRKQPTMAGWGSPEVVLNGFEDGGNHQKWGNSGHAWVPKGGGLMRLAKWRWGWESSQFRWNNSVHNLIVYSCSERTLEDSKTFLDIWYMGMSENGVYPQWNSHKK